MIHKENDCLCLSADSENSSDDLIRKCLDNLGIVYELSDYVNGNMYCSLYTIHESELLKFKNSIPETYGMYRDFE